MFVFPLNKDGYVGRTPYVFIGLAVVNGLLLTTTYLLSSPHDVFLRHGFIPATPHLTNVFTSIFLHAGFWHFAGNMFFLWMFGYRVENTFGRLLFLTVYLLCGLGATAVHFLTNPHSPIPCVGASGAISGIVGCYFVMFPRSRFEIEIYLFRFHLKSIPTRTHGAVGAWVAEQSLLGLLSGVAAFSSTAFWAHVGGFATGVAITYVILFFAPHLARRGDQPFVVRTVKGIVFDEDGKPLEKAQFIVRGDQGEIFSALTSPKGRFQIKGVPDGCYSFNLTYRDHPSIDGTVVVKEHTKLSLPIRLRMAPRIAEEETMATAAR